MKDFIRTKGVKLGIVVALLIVIILVAANALGGRAGVFSNAAGAVTQPLQRAAMSVVGWFEGIYGYLYEYNILVAENEQLRSQLAEAQEQARSGADAIDENVRLRELLNFKEKHMDLEIESAKIVSWNPTNWSSAFTISKGENSGIELGACVITEYGAFVGQVIELGDTWANVRTVVDVEMNVGALVGDTGSAAMVVGEFSLMHQGYAKLSHLTEGLSLFTGDTVLTSGKGGKFPSGIVIGTVAEVLTEAGGQTPYGVVEPACDLSRLSQVFVVKAFDVVE